MSYIDLIKEKARQDKKTIVLPECTDRRTLIAASHIIEEGVANLILIGNEEKIKADKDMFGEIKPLYNGGKNE